MTNITLSIDDDIYKKMRKYSEIKWSTYVKQCIERRLMQLEQIQDDQSVLTMLASQDVLNKDWNNTHDDRWNNV